MKQTLQEQITELNRNCNDLGEDLLLIESVIIACHCENEFPPDYITSSLHRMMSYTEQHLEDIQYLTDSVIRKHLRAAESS